MASAVRLQRSHNRLMVERPSNLALCSGAGQTSKARSGGRHFDLRPSCTRCCETGQSSRRPKPPQSTRQEAESSSRGERRPREGGARRLGGSYGCGQHDKRRYGSSPPFEDRPDGRTSATPARWTGRIVRPDAPALTDPATPPNAFMVAGSKGHGSPRSTAVELWAPTIPLTSLYLPCEIGALGRSKAAPSGARGDHGAADGHGEGTP
jgi:hypothetical protein